MSLKAEIDKLIQTELLKLKSANEEREEKSKEYDEKKSDHLQSLFTALQEVANSVGKKYVRLTQFNVLLATHNKHIEMIVGKDLDESMQEDIHWRIFVNNDGQISLYDDRFTKDRKEFKGVEDFLNYIIKKIAHKIAEYKLEEEKYR